MSATAKSDDTKASDTKASDTATSDDGKSTATAKADDGKATATATAAAPDTGDSAKSGTRSTKAGDGKSTSSKAGSKTADDDSAGTPGRAASPQERDAAVTDPAGIRAADAASAQAYAKDGILGAPGSEIPGNRTAVTRDPAGADHREGRPATQVEGERLSAEADRSAQMKAERATREPGYATTGLAGQADGDGDKKQGNNRPAAGQRTAAKDSDADRKAG